MIHYDLLIVYSTVIT